MFVSVTVCLCACLYIGLCLSVVLSGYVCLYLLFCRVVCLSLSWSVSWSVFICLSVCVRLYVSVCVLSVCLCLYVSAYLHLSDGLLFVLPALHCDDVIIISIWNDDDAVHWWTSTWYVVHGNWLQLVSVAGFRQQPVAMGDRGLGHLGAFVGRDVVDIVLKRWRGVRLDALLRRSDVIVLHLQQTAKNADLQSSIHRRVWGRDVKQNQENRVS